jgi:hypothetical protein
LRTKVAHRSHPRVSAEGRRADGSEAGAKAGYWLVPQNGGGVNVLVFDTEDEARAVAARFVPGHRRCLTRLCVSSR